MRMSNISMTIIMFVVVIAVVLAIPILIGSYVYRDAKKRKMDAVLWTVVAIIVPGLVGLIIYLVVRGNSVDVNCPVCDREISNSYTLCPHCGAPLKPFCSNCNAVIDLSWKLCPQCGTAISPDDYPDVKTPKPRKDKRILLLVVILAVLPLSILLIGILAMRFSYHVYTSPGESGGTFGGGSSSSSSGRMSSASAMESFHLVADADEISPEVGEWIASCDAQGIGVYVLRLSTGKILELGKRGGDDTQDDRELSFYVYINQVQDYTLIEGAAGLTGMMNINAKTAEIRYSTMFDEDEGLQGDYELSEFYVDGQAINDIKVFIDGKQIDAVITELL